MKKECERTRKALPNYLRGHVFRTTRSRIERHLAQCVICRSEFEALKRADETRRILKDINMSEGMMHAAREGVSSLKKLKKIAYRPLWIAGICLAGAGIYYYAMMPRQLDLEIENIVKTGPAAIVTAPAVTVTAPTEQRTAMTPSTPGVPVPQHAVADAASERLTIMIVVENDQAAVRRINEILRGHGQLRNKKFTETEKEVSGTLTPHELLTLFSRLEPAGKIVYNRKRFASLSNAEPVPFVLKLQPAPTARTADKPAIPSKPAVKTSMTQTPAEEMTPAPSEAVSTSSGTQ